MGVKETNNKEDFNFVRSLLVIEFIYFYLTYTINALSNICSVLRGPVLVLGPTEHYSFFFFF